MDLLFAGSEIAVIEMVMSSPLSDHVRGLRCILRVAI